jgi:acetyl-CoA synthetase
MEHIPPTVTAFCKQAHDDPEGFWASAAERLPWFRRWDRVFLWEPPTFRWFVGAETNLAYNCLDHHVARGWGSHPALICLDERGGRRVFSYTELWNEVRRASAALRGLGIGRGDRVAIYMPTCAEAIILMLACTRIGAIHLVVFAGFGANAFGDRMQMAGVRAVFAADVTWRKGRDVPLLGLLDGALAAGGASVERVVVLRRGPAEPSNAPGHGLLQGALAWPEFLELGAEQDSDHVVLEANEPAYILATSGTTAKPKLAVHTHGGYAVHIHSMGQWVFGLRPTDVFWATSDIGWAVGHSYMVYAPLLAGCTSIAYEGALDYPDAATPYRILEENRVTGLFMSPTAARLLMRHGLEPARRHDLSSVERTFCAGEVLNPPVWQFLQQELFQGRVPVIDNMWQTETSGPIVGNPYGLGLLPIKPGSAGILLPGISGRILTPEGTPCAPGERGIFVMDRPFPGLTASLWGDPERYGRDYWQRIPGHTVYFTGDATAIDEDGYVWFSGRSDEIIKIAAHRIGTIEVESAFLAHPAVAEAGVTGRPDELRGEVISAFIVLKANHAPAEKLRQALIQTVRERLGPVAVIGELHFVHLLPKTRSGKIMRRVLRAVVLGTDPGDVSTLEEEGSVKEAREAWREMRAAVVDRGALPNVSPSGIP